jgi:hypothetical protein
MLFEKLEIPAAGLIEYGVNVNRHDSDLRFLFKKPVVRAINLELDPG